MFKRLLVAFDGSDESKRALDVAIGLACTLRAELFSVSAEEGVLVPDAVPGFGPTESEVTVADEDNVEVELLSLSAQAAQIAASKGAVIRATSAPGEDEVEAVLAAISDYGIDLLVVGLRRHSGLVDRLKSHAAEALEDRAPCSVLGVR